VFINSSDSENSSREGTGRGERGCAISPQKTSTPKTAEQNSAREVMVENCASAFYYHYFEFIMDAKKITEHAITNVEPKGEKKIK